MHSIGSKLWIITFKKILNYFNDKEKIYAASSYMTIWFLCYHFTKKEHINGSQDLWKNNVNA